MGKIHGFGISEPSIVVKEVSLGGGGGVNPQVFNAPFILACFSRTRSGHFMVYEILPIQNCVGIPLTYMYLP